MRKGAQPAVTAQNGEPAHEAAAAALAGLSLTQGTAANGGSHAWSAPPAIATASPADALKAAQAALSGIAGQRPASARQAAAPPAVGGPQRQQQSPLPPAPQHLPTPQHLAAYGQVRRIAATAATRVSQLLRPST